MKPPGERFAAFAEIYSDLPLYHRLCMGASRDPEVAGIIDVARPGQQRPVILLAAVHDLILRRPELPLGRWYSSVTPVDELATGDPWPVFRSTVLEHRDGLERVIAVRATQTNEVNRAVIVAAMTALATRDVTSVPVSLLELGTSAGLLLGSDTYRVDVGGMVVGDADSSVQCTGSLLAGSIPGLSAFPPTILERVGIDRDPVDLDDADGVRWLEACMWPDQPWRMERFRAAVDQLRRDPPRVVAGDLVDAFDGVVAGLDDSSHLVVFDIWALTYVHPDRREQLVERLEVAATTGRPVSWLSAEPPDAVPGIVAPPVPRVAEGRSLDTVLGVRRWRGGRELEPLPFGWAHAHGNWIAPV